MKQGEILKFIINVGICLKWLLKKNALKKKSSGFHWKNGKQIEITSTEFRVLQLFMTSPNRVFTKAQISAAGWGENTYVEDNSIMVTLSKLRTKLGNEGWIKNIRGLGYRMEIMENADEN